MGISLADDQLLLVLDECIAAARGPDPVPEVWVRRVERLGDLGIRTYVAALGAALLAKATDPRVDSLTQDLAAGPHGYSLRKVAELLARQNQGRFHMGATGRTGVIDWPHVTTGEALSRLTTEPEPGERVRGKWGHLLVDIPPGDNYLFYTAERDHPDPLFAWRSRYWSFLLKLAPDRPSPTIQAQPGPNVGPFHWENRRLRIPELRRLFTFPDDFELLGRRASVQAQKGRDRRDEREANPDRFAELDTQGSRLTTATRPSRRGGRFERALRCRL